MRCRVKPYLEAWGLHCPTCNAAVVYEFGKLDATASRKGVIKKHMCQEAQPDPPMNEREWAAFAAEMEHEFPQKIDRPAPPLPVAAKAPRKKKEDVRGLPL